MASEIGVKAPSSHAPAPVPSFAALQHVNPALKILCKKCNFLTVFCVIEIIYSLVLIPYESSSSSFSTRKIVGGGRPLV